MNTFSGIVWLQEGDQYWLYWGAANYSGVSYVGEAKWNNGKLTAGKPVAFEAVKPAAVAIPNELLVQKEDGISYLYIVLNGNNTVVK